MWETGSELYSRGSFCQALTCQEQTALVAKAVAGSQVGSQKDSEAGFRCTQDDKEVRVSRFIGRALGLPDGLRKTAPGSRTAEQPSHSLEVTSRNQGALSHLHLTTISLGRPYPTTLTAFPTAPEEGESDFIIESKAAVKTACPPSDRVFR